MTKDTLQVGGRGSALLPTSCRALKGHLTLQSIIPGWGNAACALTTPKQMGDPCPPHSALGEEDEAEEGCNHPSDPPRMSKKGYRHQKNQPHVQPH